MTVAHSSSGSPLALGLALLMASCGSSTEPGGDSGECRVEESPGVVHGFDIAPEEAVDGQLLAVATDSATILTEDGTTFVFRWLGTPLDDHFHVGDAVAVERRREALDDFPPFEAAAVVDVLLGPGKRAVALQLAHAEHYTFDDAVTVELGQVACCADCSDSAEVAVVSCQEHAVIARSGTVEREIPIADTHALADWVLTPVEASSISAVPGPASPCSSDDTERVMIGVDMLGPVE